MANDPGDSLSARAEATEAVTRMARAVASVADIPWDELPDGVARSCLLDMAYSGGDIDAFQAADGRWWVRLWGRTETCAAWAARFHV